MEDLWSGCDASLVGPIGASKASDAEIPRQQYLKTPKKSYPETEFGQWNMWGDERSRSNPAIPKNSVPNLASKTKLLSNMHGHILRLLACLTSHSLLAPCTPEIIARVQSVLASPNSEDEWTKAGYPIQQLLSYVLESDDSPNSSTSSSVFDSSDEETPMIGLDSPRKFPMHASFARVNAVPKPVFASGRFEPQEPAALPPQLAYGSDKRVPLAVTSTESFESSRIRQHGRQYSDSSVSDETTGYLSSSPSSSSSSSSSYVSTGSAQSHYYGTMASGSFESANSAFSSGHYPGHTVSSLPQPYQSMNYVPSVPGIYSTGTPFSSGNSVNFPYFGHGQIGPHLAHNGPYMPSTYGHPPPGLFHYPGAYHHHPSVTPIHFQQSEPALSLHAPIPALVSAHARIKSLDAIPTYVPSNGGYRADAAATPIESLDRRVEAQSAPPSVASLPSKSWDQSKSAKVYLPASVTSEEGHRNAAHLPQPANVSQPASQGHISARSIQPTESQSFTTAEPISTKPETNMRAGKRGHEKRPSCASSSSESSDTPRSTHSSQSSSRNSSSSSHSTSTASAVASPRSKENYDKIVIKLKEIGEEKGFEEAQAWALTQIPNMSRSSHAKFSLEMADLAKRDNCQQHARLYYQIATGLNPGDSKSWLEWAKMEEESGQLDLCEEILAEGLRHCGANSESLVLRSVRILKSRDKIQEARALIGRMLAISENFTSRQDATRTPELSRNNSSASQPTSGSRTSSGPSLSSSTGSQIENFAHEMNSAAIPPIGDVREWRIVLEGAMLEWRAGRPQLAHSILKFLQTAMPNRTQPYMSRADLCKKEGLFVDAYECIMTGLQWLPNAGMLWFEAIQLQQQLVSRLPDFNKTSAISVSENSVNASKVPTADKIAADGSFKPKSDKTASAVDSVLALGNLPSTAQEYFKSYLPKFVERALANLSPELVWKFHLEISTIYESHGDLTEARRALGYSVHACPSNLLWRVWLAGARLELFGGVEKAARRLLIKSVKSVPKKMQSTVLLECSRTEEYLGNVEQARYILTKAKRDTKFEWKVFLENILLEMRCGAFEAAIKETRAALEIHPSAGRLWAILIQAHHFCHYDKFDVTQLGTEASRGFEITKAVFHEALKEVPKSGEVWCEGARIAMHAGRFEEARRYLSFAVELTSQYGDTTIEWIRLKMLEDRANGISLDQQASIDVSSLVSSDRLAQLCTYADPNYGPVWTFCKRFPHDPCISTMQAAKTMLLDLAKSDPSMDIAHHLLGKVRTDEESRKRLIFF